MVLADDDLDIHSEGVGRAEDFDDSSSCRASWRGEAGDLNVDGEALERSVRVLLCGPTSLLLLSLFAEDTVGRGGGFVDDLISFDDENRLSHALVEGNDIISASDGKVFPGAAALGAGVVEDADDGRVASFENAGYASGAPSFAVARGFIDEDLVALHGSVELIGRDEEVFFTLFAPGRSDEGVAVAVQVDAPGDEVLASGEALDCSIV
jgi:hypothetical protein